jgi:LytR cell envelope-related transcriptional attenuator
VRLRVARLRGERGAAMSSPLALLSAAAVVLAGVAFVATNQDDPEQPVPAAAHVAPSASATPTPSRASSAPKVRLRHKKKPVVKRGQTYVEVFNNSGIHGLAGSTAARAQGAGWQVVGSDNWYGTVDASTVYFPPTLQPAAKLLAKDLGIRRVRPMIAPMRGDRLTVILTTDYVS